MANKTSRALRRHHRARMFKRAQKLQAMWWNWPESKGWLKFIVHDHIVTDEDFHKAASVLRDNMKICSCPMCCNPRHSHFSSSKQKLTMQERKENERFKYEMLEVEISDESCDN